MANAEQISEIGSRVRSAIGALQDVFGGFWPKVFQDIIDIVCYAEQGACLDLAIANRNSAPPPQEPVRIVAMAYDPVNNTMDFALSNGTVWGCYTNYDAEPFQYAEVRDGKLVTP